MSTEKMIEDRIMDSVNDGDRDITTLLWALTGIININESFCTMPGIEDMIKDIQSTHSKYPQKPRECMRVFLESMHAIIEKYQKSHEIW